jgi:hypothetical protein
MWVDDFMEFAPFRVVPTSEGKLRLVLVKNIRARKGHEELDEANILRKVAEGIKSPPSLAEYGDELFYVTNGHHRVAAAVLRGQILLLAIVHGSVQPEPGETMEDVWHRASYGRYSQVAK